jgi:hypothetical protein
MLGIIQWMIKEKHALGRELADGIRSGETIFQAMNRMHWEGKFQP